MTERFKRDMQGLADVQTIIDGLKEELEAAQKRIVEERNRADTMQKKWEESQQYKDEQTRKVVAETMRRLTLSDSEEDVSPRKRKRVSRNRAATETSKVRNIRKDSATEVESNSSAGEERTVRRLSGSGDEGISVDTQGSGVSESDEDSVISVYEDATPKTPPQEV